MRESLRFQSKPRVDVQSWGLVIAALCAVFWAAPAQSQVRLPKCGGWPHLPGQPGLIVAPGAGPCRGEFFKRRFGPGEIVDVQASLDMSRGGSFQMLNRSEFIYKPAPSGYERITLIVTSAYRGMERTGPAVYLATTEKEFRASGGTDAAPPPGFTESRSHRRQLLMR